MGKIRKVARILKIPMLKYDYKRTLQSDYGGIFDIQMHYVYFP